MQKMKEIRLYLEVLQWIKELKFACCVDVGTGAVNLTLPYAGDNQS